MLIGLALGMMAAGPALSMPATETPDEILVAAAMDRQLLQFEMRGQRVALETEAQPEEQGCATRVITDAPGSSTRFARLLRWRELAWVGTIPDGSTEIVFYDAEGHLPVDVVTIAPQDPARMHSALERLSERCRNESGKPGLVLVSQPERTRSCYLAAYPQLLMVAPTEGSFVQSPRLSVSLLARENHQLELNMLFEQLADGKSGTPAVTFTIAEPTLINASVKRAEFMVDGKRFPVSYSIAAFGTTRLRIAVDTGKADDSGFATALPSAREVSLSLIGAESDEIGRFHFHPAAALTPGLAQFREKGWTCQTALAASPPASAWQKPTS